MGCEIHAEQWWAIMLTTGRGNKRGGLHWNLPQNLGGRREINTPDNSNA